VTPTNFLNVIQGNKDAMANIGTGKVLESTSGDRVFIYFADHGAPGLIAFPHEYLYADKLIKAFQTMHSKKMYDHMTVYVEACESGSMFDGLLPTDLNIYATTAANPDESSWGYYCYPQDKVNGKHINSCLGDLYSISWLEDADKANMQTQSLQTQYTNVKKRTTKSHVMQYGSKDFTDNPIGNYEATYNTVVSAAPSAIQVLMDRILPVSQDSHGHAVDSRDTKLHHLYAKLMTETGKKTKHHLALQEELLHRQKIDTIFEDFSKTLNLPKDGKARVRTTTDFECLRAMVNTFNMECGDLKEYELKYVKSLALSCQTGLPFDVLRHALMKAC